MRVWRTVAAAASFAAGGCALLIGEPDPYAFAEDGAAPAEAAVADSAQPPVDAPSDVLPAEAGTATYNDFTSTASWDVFDVTQLSSSLPDVQNFFSAGFDGRYVYFFHVEPPVTVLRYDTTGSFTAKSSYALFDLSTIDGRTPTVRGAVYASPYLYLVPQSINTDGSLTLSPFVRYDPRNDPTFSDKSAWTLVDVGSSFPGIGHGFWGGTFDGTYVYYTAFSFAPQSQVRYRTTADFGSPSSFELVSVGAIDVAQNAPATPTADAAAGHIMSGAVYDGRYVVYPPAQLANNFLRYDTTTAFTNASTAWSAFDITRSVDGGGSGSASFFHGGTFDGRYSYYHFDRAAALVRYDHQQAFGDPGAWAFSRPAALGTRHPQSNLFDGRYVYLSSLDQHAARYDTTKDFFADASYESFDLTTLNAGATDFGTTIFDGRYVYYAPNNAPVLVRFDAKSPRSFPPTYHGSAF